MTEVQPTPSPHLPKAQPVPNSDLGAVDGNVNGLPMRNSPLRTPPTSAINGNHVSNDSIAPPIFTSITDADIPKEATLEISVANALPVLDAQPVLPPVHDGDAVNIPPHIEQPISDVRDESAPTEHVLESGEAAGILSVSVQETASDPTPLPAQPVVEDAMDTSEDKPVDSMDLVDTTAPAIPNTMPAEENAALPTDVTLPTATTSDPVATPIDEPLSAGVVRSREDDDGPEEPSAKRTKTDTEFRIPDTPASAHPTTEQPSDTVTVSLPRDTATAGDGLSSLVEQTYDTSPMTDLQEKFMLKTIQSGKKTKVATMFNKPVDHVALGIPTYPQIIKNPMDLSTVEEKLKAKKYGSVNDVVQDLALIISNCLTFNGPTHMVSIAAKNLEAWFKRALQPVPSANAPVPEPAKKKRPSIPRTTTDEKPRRPSRTNTVTTQAQSPSTPSGETYALQPNGIPSIRRDSTVGDGGRPKREIHRPPPKDLPYSSSKPRRKKFAAELKFCEWVLSNLKHKKFADHAFPFLVPVDPVALNIPRYFSIVKQPMDISTVEKKLKNNEYEKASDFESDVRLIFSNCFSFNKPGEHVHTLGMKLENTFNELWASKDQWIATNTSNAASPDGTPDVDEEEDDEEDDLDSTAPKGMIDIGSTLASKRMYEIQAQIAKLSQEAAALVSGTAGKKASPKAPGKKAKKAKAEKKTKQRTSSFTAPVPMVQKTAQKPKAKRPPPTVTREQMTEIANASVNFNSQQMTDVIKMIKNNVPKYRDLPDDELELDLNELPNDVCYMLLQYCRKINKKSAAAKYEEDDDEEEDEEYEAQKRASRTATTKSRKNKPMSKAEQEAQIAKIQSQLNQFDNPNAAGAMSSDVKQESSDDEDDDDDSSEEE